VILQSSLKKPKALLFKLLLVIVPLLGCTMIFAMLQQDFPNELFVPYLGTAVMLILVGYHLFTTIRPVLQTIQLYEDYMVVKSAFRGNETRFKYSEINGFKKQLVPGNGKARHSLFLFSKGKRVAEVSELLTSNVAELEKAFGEKTTYLGKESYSVFKNVLDRMLCR